MSTSLSSPTAGSSFLPWRAVLIAGIVASLVFQILEMILMPLFGGGGPWSAARMIAAMVMGRGVLPPPASFDPVVVAVAVIVDVVLAVIYAGALSLLIRSWTLRASLVAGAVFGAALYVVNFYGFTALFPWFEMGRNGVTLFTHIVFSLTAVLVYKRLQPDLPRAAV